jgi:hypothetical protein
VIYFLFRKAGGGGGVSMSPYRNKTTPCTGIFFCIPLGSGCSLSLVGFCGLWAALLLLWLIVGSQGSVLTLDGGQLV